MAWQDPREIKLIVIHHSAQSVPMDKDWLSIRAIHLKRFRRIGYHRIMERDGALMDGCRIQRVGAHAPPNYLRFGLVGIGWNEELAPVSVSREAAKAGWQPEWAWTEDQWRMLVEVHLPYLCKIMPQALICGHRQTKPTLCPGFNVEKALIEHGWKRSERLLVGRCYRGYRG